jgi:large subunit ribosomal protein L13
MKTYQAKQAEIKHNWHLVDAKDKILGRLSSKIVKQLMGKHKANYTPHMDMGDYVVVINAAQVKLSGKKEKQKTYKKHSGYPGGFKEVKVSKLRAEQPEKIIELAVRRMLPDNRLRDKRMRRLKVFAQDKHPYAEKIK